MFSFHIVNNNCLASFLIIIRSDHGHDTVGAVAVDRKGNTAFATSTGGITGKCAGRVGDSPLIGRCWSCCLFQCFFSFCPCYLSLFLLPRTINNTVKVSIHLMEVSALDFLIIQMSK